MLHKEIPFLRIGLPLCAGIITGLYYKPDLRFLVIVTIIILMGFAASLFFNKYTTNQIFGYSLTLSLYTTGLFLYSNEKDRISGLKPEETIFSCILSDYPVEKENTYLLTVRLTGKNVRSKPEPVRGSIIIYNRKDSSLKSFLPGDLLILKCKPVEIINKGNPYEFDYKFFMQNQGIRYYAFTSSSDILRHTLPKYRKPIHRALIIREKIIGMYKQRGVTGERLALVAAITLGQKNLLEPEQKQNFIKAGVMHIMAVSGLHAVILSMFVFYLLYFLKKRFNILRIIITILILWCFAFVTGLTPSVLRATIMFTFLQAGGLMKREPNGINPVLASAFVLIVARPSVIFDAGFLLSYFAVIYIISFYFDFYQKILFKSWFADKIWQSAVVTIVAQLGTLPLTIMLFNRFPTYFILTNIIIVPLSNLLIIIGCLLPLLYPVQFLSHFLGFILSSLTGLTEWLTARASSLPLSNIENIGMTTAECILLAMTIFLFTHYIIRKQPFSILYPLSFLILFAVSVTIVEISTRTSNELIVYNTPGFSTIGVKTGKILNLYSDTTVTAPEVIRHCATLGLKINKNLMRNKFFCIRAGEKKILICKSADQTLLNRYLPDMIILTGSKPLVGTHLTFRQIQGTIILTSAVSPGFRMPAQVPPSENVTVYFVRKSGAYYKRI